MRESERERREKESRRKRKGEGSRLDWTPSSDAVTNVTITDGVSNFNPVVPTAAPSSSCHMKCVALG